MREMGYSAWLSTSYPPYRAQREESMRGRLELAVTTGYHGAIIIPSGPVSVRGGDKSRGEETGSRFVPFLTVISLQGCYRLVSTLAMGSLPG